MIKKIILLLTILFSNFTFASVISGEGKIIHVVDGDTFDIQAYRNSDVQSLLNTKYIDKKHVDSNVFRIRLANINTEESKHVNSSKNTAFGQETSTVVKNTFLNKDVYFKCYDRGYYGRAICSLNTKKGDIGYWLISNNYSPYVKKYGQHPEYHTKYLSANRKSNKPKITVSSLKNSHRDNAYHNNDSYYNKLKETQQGFKESINPILETAPESIRGKLLHKFKNRNNIEHKGTVNLNSFKNRLGNKN